jgi:hypothetical protein
MSARWHRMRMAGYGWGRGKENFGGRTIGGRMDSGWHKQRSAHPCHHRLCRSGTAPSGWERPAMDCSRWKARRTGLDKAKRIVERLDSHALPGFGRHSLDRNRWRRLSRLKGWKVATFTTREGLPDNTVSQILEDDAGNLWLGGDRGIVCVSKRELEDLAAQKIAAVYPQVYGRTEGMLSEECISWCFSYRPQNQVRPALVSNAGGHCGGGPASPNGGHSRASRGAGGNAGRWRAGYGGIACALRPASTGSNFDTRALISTLLNGCASAIVWKDWIPIGWKPAPAVSASFPYVPPGNTVSRLLPATWRRGLERPLGASVSVTVLAVPLAGRGGFACRPRWVCWRIIAVASRVVEKAQTAAPAGTIGTRTRPGPGTRTHRARLAR